MSTDYPRLSLDSLESRASEETLLRGPLEEFEIADDPLAKRSRRPRFKIILGALAALLVVVGTAELLITRWRLVPRLFGPCERLMVRSFDSYTGFASEYGVFLRAAALSSAMNWTVVPDSTTWIYGELSEFFAPPSYDCTLPTGLLDNATDYQEFGTPGWEDSARLRLTRNYEPLLKLDALVREKGIDTAQTAELLLKQHVWRMDADHLTLPYGESVPRGAEDAFRAQAEALRRLWVPNARMQAQIQRLVVRLGLDEMDVHKRGPVVVVQIRLGDKKTEQEDIIAAGSHMQFGDMSIYYRAVELALARLYEPEFTADPFPKPAGEGLKKPLVVVMTAETGVVESLEALDKDKRFEFLLTPSNEFSVAEQEEFDRVMASAPALARRWDQNDLPNASLALRLAITRQLIAELTVYSRHADAFIVSGNSNLGRLALTLSGEEGALGRPGQRVLGGRVRSIDVPFYPTTWPRSIFP